MHAADAALEVRAPSSAPVSISSARRSSIGRGSRKASTQPLRRGFRPRLGRAVRRLRRRRCVDDPRPVSSCRRRRHAKPPGHFFVLPTVALAKVRRPKTAVVRAANPRRARSSRLSPAARPRKKSRRCSASTARAAARARLRGRHPVGDRAHARQLQFPVPHRSAIARRGARRRVYRVSDLDLASRLSFFLVEQHSRRHAADAR